MNDYYFLSYFFIYVSSIFLHGLTRVNHDFRASYVTLPFLIFAAGYGYEYTIKKLHSLRVMTRKFG